MPSWNSVFLFRAHSVCADCRSLIQSKRLYRPLHRRYQSRQSAPNSQPLEDYYSLLLSQPLPSQTPTTRASRPDPGAKKEATLSKARVIFGSRLAGPAERKRSQEANSINVAGVMVPSRPTEPDNCCMSGCVNCVWDVYRDDLEEWAAKRKEADRRLRAEDSIDDDGGALWAGGREDLFGGVPVGIREFMRTEKALKEKHLKQGTVGG